MGLKMRVRIRDGESWEPLRKVKQKCDTRIPAVAATIHIYIQELVRQGLE